MSRRPVRVLNTRPHEQSAELSRLLRDAGFEPIAAPAIEVVPAWNPADLTRVRERLATGAYAWLVLQSQNAGRFLLEGLGAASLGEVIRTTPVVCGSATATALGLGNRTDTLERFSATQALAWLASRVQPGARVLVPRAAEGRDELVAGLGRLGARVDAPVCYTTRPVGPSALADTCARLRRSDIGVVTLASPSALHALRAALGSDADAVLRRVAVVCLGATTAEACRRAGVRVDAIADDTSMPGLVRAVQRAAAAHEVAA